jgi:hypothetical protein
VIVLLYLTRGVTRLVALVVLPVLALAALAFAVAAVIGQHSAASLARSTQLTSAWREVGGFLARVAPAGHTVVVLAAAAAVLLGLIVVFGALAPSRERELHLAGGDPDLGIRRRALANALSSVPRRTRGATSVRVALHPRRHTVKVATTRSPRVPQADIDTALRAQLEPLASAFALKTRIRGSVGRRRKARLS